MEKILYDDFATAYASSKLGLEESEVIKVVDALVEGDRKIYWLLNGHTVGCRFEYKDSGSCGDGSRLGYNTCERHKKFEKTVENGIYSDWREGLEDWEIKLIKKMIKGKK